MRTLAIAAALALAGCSRNIVYTHYEHVPESGWEQDASLSFLTDTMHHDGPYAEELHVRFTGSYPYRLLTLIVSQTAAPSGYSRTDTVTIELTDDKGNTRGHGTMHKDVAMPLTPVALASGDRLHVTVRHHMHRFCLPGITDLGFKLSTVE